MYPTHAEINGDIYPINTDYRVAKECYEIINDDTISDQERALAVIYKLFGFVPLENGEAFLDKASLFLTCGQKQGNKSDEPPDFDVNEDEGFIEASFKSCYGVDLDEVNMHWWKFNDLVQGLDKHCILSRVREIRNYDLNEIKDPIQRSKMAEAQERLKLPERISTEEQEKIDEFDALFGGD